MSMRTSFGTDSEMADNDSSDASGTLPCCAEPSGEHGACLSVTKGFLMNSFSIAVGGQQMPLVTLVRFLSRWPAVALFGDAVAVGGLASLFLLPLCLVTTLLLRGLHGIPTTSSTLPLGEACEDTRRDDEAVALPCPWQLFAKMAGVVAYRGSLLLALARRAVDLPARDRSVLAQSWTRATLVRFAVVE